MIVKCDVKNDAINNLFMMITALCIIMGSNSVLTYVGIYSIRNKISKFIIFLHAVCICWIQCITVKQFKIRFDHFTCDFA